MLQSILDKIDIQIRGGLPFVLYSLPNDSRICVMLQREMDKRELKEEIIDGFVFNPFDSKKKSFFISALNSEIIETEWEFAELSQDHIDINETQLEKDKHLALVSKTIAEIVSTKIFKIVVSRKKETAVKDLQLELLINRLLNLYPSAFRYLWYHPDTGLWCGASPEILLEANNGIFKTMALAGTRKFELNANTKWTDKEIEEQQYVTDSILENLEKVTTYVKVSKPYTQRAGDLEHLRTDIEGAVRKNGKTFLDIAKALHPTPAVCGRPKLAAMKFITNNEDYDREFYTGFLGPVSKIGNCCNLFVNLRCLKFDDKKAILFAGGGITEASTPNDEWQETHFKLQTMVKVLAPIL